jgi:hypothetical protein
MTYVKFYMTVRSTPLTTLPHGPQRAVFALTVTVITVYVYSLAFHYASS